MNIDLYQTAPLQQMVGEMLTQVIDETLYAGPNQVSFFRGCAAEAVSQNNNLFSEIYVNILQVLENEYLSNQINPNNQNQVFNLVSNSFVDAVPYIFLNYGPMNQLNAQEAHGVRNDANKYCSYIGNIQRQLARHYSNSNGMMYGNNNAGSFATRGGMAMRNNNVGGNGGSRWGNVRGNNFGGMGANRVDNTFSASNTQAHDVFGRGNNSSSSTQQNDSNDYFAIKRRRLAESNANNTANKQQDNSAYNELVDESAVLGTPTVVHGNVNQYEERFDKSGSNETIVNNQTAVQVEEDGFPIVPNNRRKMAIGRNWLVGLWINTSTKGYEDINEVKVRRKLTPEYLYPFDYTKHREKLSEDKDGLYFEYYDAYGLVQREYVFAFNASNKLWQSYNYLNKRCMIELDEHGLPCQVLYDLTEEERMELKDHIIPGKTPGILGSALIPNRENPPSLEEEIKYLTMTDEEREYQEAEIIANGGEVNEYNVTINDNEIIADNLPSLVTEIIDDVYTEHGNSRLVESDVTIMNPISTKKRQLEVVRKIKECKTFDDYRDKIIKPLTKAREFVLLRKLSEMIDIQFSKILLCLDLTDISVTEIVECYSDLEERDDIITKSSRQQYNTLVEEMFASFTITNNDDEYLSDSDTPTIVSNTATVTYVDRSAGELNITLDGSENNQNGWVCLVRDTGSEISNLITASLVRRNRKSSKPTRDTYLLTSDGVLIEFIPASRFDINHVFYRICKLTQ
jgi:hypothetical protein|nr:MAG TPA: hypothetical protein [Caudoviricetes sp.]